MVSELCDVVLCVVIVLTNKGTEERLKGITTEAVLVMSMLEECTKMLQRGGAVGVEFVACLL